MHLSITDQDGCVIGELDTAVATMWRDILSYVAVRWEAQAHTETLDRLRLALAASASPH